MHGGHEIYYATRALLDRWIVIMNGTVEYGLELLSQDRTEEAFAILRPHAERGDMRAQAAIGLLYQTGMGVKRDVAAAIQWLEAAAKQNSGEAAHNLGTLYLTCEPDLPQNAEESRRWYLKARDLGFVVATPDWYEKLEK